MNCTEFEERLQQELDGQAAPGRSSFDQHAAACASCRELYRALQMLERGLRLVDRPEPPPSLAGRITAMVLAERDAGRRVRRRVQWVAALAAGLLLIVFAGSYRPHGHSSPTLLGSVQGWVHDKFFGTAPVPPPSQFVIHEEIREPATSEVLPTPVPSLSLKESMGEAGSALTSLLGRTADQTVDHGKLLLPDSLVTNSASDAEAWPPKLDAPTRSLKEAGQGVSSSIEPVANSARRAVYLFLREIPPMDVQN